MLATEFSVYTGGGGCQKTSSHLSEFSKYRPSANVVLECVRSSGAQEERVSASVRIG